MYICSMYRLNIFLFMLMFSLISFTGAAQIMVKGKVVDSTNTAAPFISVALINAKDSSLLKGNISNDKGEYEFENIKKGNYLIKAVSVGYINSYSNFFSIDSLAKTVSIPDLKLNSNGIDLKEISITAIKPAVEFKDGMIIMNVENSPLAAGNTVFDLLRRLPGVYIDNQNNISLNGRSGVRVLIDGRLQRLTGQQLASMLMSMSAETVSKMEVMSNPPVKYDAEGTGGLINIITNKVKVVGFSGNISGGISKGYAYRGGLDGSLNYKGKKFTFYSSMGFGDRTFYNKYTFDKIVTFNNNKTYLNEIGATTDLQNYLNGKIGLDLYPNKKTTIGFLINGGINNTPHTDRGINSVSGYNDVGFDHYKFDMNENNKWTLPTYNVYAERKLDTTGGTLSFSADYIDYKQVRNILSENVFLDNTNSEVLPANVFKARHNSTVKVFAPKLDLKKNIGKIGSFEAGVKAGFTENTNDYTFARQNTSTKLFDVDTNVSNKYLYDEVILAGYLNFKREFKYGSFQIGGRGENTEVNAINKTNGFKLTRNYFRFFPNLSLSLSKNRNHTFQLSLSSRIQRPNYPDLNPYKSYQDYYSSTIGNPNLLPQGLYIGNVNYSFKNSIYNTLSYAHFVTPVIYYDLQNDTTKETVSQATNFTGNNYYYGYQLYIQKQIKQWWNLSFNGTAYYTHFEGTIKGNHFERATTTFNLWLNNDLILPKKFKIQIVGSYNAPSIFGINFNGERWRLDIGIKKNLFKDKLSLGVNFADIFYTDINRSRSQFQNQNTYFVSRNDTQRLQFNLNYKFGKIRVQKRDNEVEEGGRLKKGN
jgi:hypothetical protein